MLLPAKSRPRTFEIYLRTGRRVHGDSVELKFNPWHDPQDGRFTFAGSGRYFPAGSQATGRPRGDGGSFGGGGASGSWDAASRPRAAGRARPTSASGSIARPVPRPPDIVTVAPEPKRPPQEPFLRQVKNGYDFRIDAHVRTRRASGELHLGSEEGRSRRAQARAGGEDRRRTDDGGHYIAARFNGPRDAFNHFAQDSSFNRGQYRALEDNWAKALREGKRVFVDVIPEYRGESQRPSKITVVYVIDGKKQKREFPNGE